MLYSKKLSVQTIWTDRMLLSSHLVCGSCKKPEEELDDWYTSETQKMESWHKDNSVMNCLPNPKKYDVGRVFITNLSSYLKKEIFILSRMQECCC